MITKKMTFGQMREMQALKDLVPYFVFSKGAVENENATSDMCLEDVHAKQPTWSADDMLLGLQRVEALAESKEEFVYSVYGEEEIKADPEKEHVKLFHFPAQSKAFVILASGGAYGSVCSLSESFPVAAKLNELGVTVFCLNYRVGPPNLMPKPMDDLAAAYRFIAEHADMLEVDPARYAVGGFSAGGHLAASWGTKELGYHKYGCPAPEILLLDYPMISMWKAVGRMPEPIRNMMFTGYFGEHYTEETCKPYNIDDNIDKDYPPVYLIQAENDSVVSIENSQKMAELLEQYQIPFRYEHPKTGGHGYGLGSDADAAGWVERALEFWKELNK